MMVEPAVLPEKALIGAGGDEGLIFDGTDRERLCRFAEGFWTTDAKSCSLRFVAQAEDISTKIDQGVLDAFFFEVLFDAIGDIALAMAPRSRPMPGVSKVTVLPFTWTFR